MLAQRVCRRDPLPRRLDRICGRGPQLARGQESAPLARRSADSGKESVRPKGGGVLSVAWVVMWRKSLGALCGVKGFCRASTAQDEVLEVLEMLLHDLFGKRSRPIRRPGCDRSRIWTNRRPLWQKPVGCYWTPSCRTNICARKYSRKFHEPHRKMLLSESLP
jgi:hypothetical protein